MKCSLCLGELSTGDTDVICLSCRNKMDSAKESYKQMQPYYQYGWVCPKCGSVYSPMTASCYVCAQKNRFDITSVPLDKSRIM